MYFFILYIFHTVTKYIAIESTQLSLFHKTLCLFVLGICCIYQHFYSIRLFLHTLEICMYGMSEEICSILVRLVFDIVYRETCWDWPPHLPFIVCLSQKYDIFCEPLNSFKTTSLTFTSQHWQLLWKFSGRRHFNWKVLACNISYRNLLKHFTVISCLARKYNITLYFLIIMGFCSLYTHNHVYGKGLIINVSICNFSIIENEICNRPATHFMQAIYW